MNDLERQLQDALDETAARVPVSEDAWLRNEALLHEPPHRHSRKPWLILATAASVVGVLIAVAVLTLPGGSKTPPAVPSPTPTGTPAVIPTPASPSPPVHSTTAPSAATTSPAVTTPANTVNIGDARLTLPSGWVSQVIVPPDQGQNILLTYCLMPKPGPAPASQNDATCPISFAEALTGTSTPQMSVDTPGGLVSNPEYCGPGGGVTNDLLAYSDAELGARPADYRRWLFVCKDGTQWPIEQYVADDTPGYVLFSSHATAEVHGIMAEIARTAQLPAISAPLRLSDFGIVRSVTSSAGSYHILLDRVVQGIPDLINNNPQTYPYDVPAALVGGQAPKVGSLVQLLTDGVEMTSFVTMP